MTSPNGSTLESTALAERAACILDEQRRRNLCQTDRLFAGLLAFEWVAGVFMALVISPRTWAGQVSQTHFHVWAALVLGAAIAAFPIFLALVRPATALTRHSIAVAQMLFGALIIHLTGGRIESHFHVFGSLAFLAFYRDWRVLLSASSIVAVDHLLRGFFWPQSVYGVLSGAEWRWVEHAGWVIFEDVFLITSCLRSVREMNEIAQRQALLEASNLRTERTVQERTGELRERNRELLEATAKLREGEARQRAIFESAIDSILTFNHAGKVLEVNAAGELAFGRRQEEALGLDLTEFITFPALEQPPDDGRPECLVRRVERILGKRIEVEALHASGTRFPAELAITRTVFDGAPLFTCYLRDLTERKQAGQALARAEEEKIMAEAANRAKNEFLSRMSHELRTPLNAILGFNQLLEMNELTDDQRDCVEQITRGGKYLLGLINEVLDIARIEAGRMDLSPEPVRVGDSIQEVLDLIRPLAAERNVRLWEDVAGANGHCVVADNQKLKQVLLNLLSNAVKYNCDRGEVRLACEAAAPGRLRLVVSDTGPGIAPEKLSRLFVPFDRLGAEQTGVEGNGLGLALSKNLVELMGGTLTVTSVVGQGSRFCVELAEADDPAERAAEMEAEVPEPVAVPTEARTVLYIEDNLDNLRLIQRILRHRPGVQLITAMQGNLGLELARQHRPDVVLLDVHLPDLNGEQVLRRLLASPESRHIPVVILSADATERQIERLRAAGAWDYLTKPIDVSRFLDLVDQALTEGARPR